MQGGKTVLGSSTGHWADAFQRKDHGVEPCASAGGHITLPMVVDKKKPVWVVGRSGAMVEAHTALVAGNSRGGYVGRKVEANDG
jgi:hypothetical protein